MADLNAGISLNTTPTVTENPMPIEITQNGTTKSTMSEYNHAALQMVRPNTIPTPPPTIVGVKGEHR